jgi:hypothetical protein
MMQFHSVIPADNPRKSVFIGIGANDGTVEVLNLVSLFGSSALLRAARISVTLCVEAGNCHVDDMRNGIVASFLESGCDELVFIDEDVGFDPKDLLKLIMHDRDLVGGVYPKKEDEPNFPVFTNPGDLWSDESGLVEVHGLPTGFMKIKRHVIERLWADEPAWTGSDGREYRSLFERGIADGRRWSGDYMFCRKWIRVGGKLYADPSFTMTHTGKKTWAGDLGSFWRRKHGVDPVEALKDGTATSADFRALHEEYGNPWAASPELLETLWKDASGQILECGSGLSTLVLATRGKVTALEHDTAYAERTKALLADHGLEADVKVCGLKDGWYDFGGGEYDCLVIDGPPRGVSRREIALDRVKAPLVIWDDFDGEKKFRVLRTA